MPKSLETKAALKSMQLALLGRRTGVPAPVRRRPTLIFLSSFIDVISISCIAFLDHLIIGNFFFRPLEQGNIAGFRCVSADPHPFVDLGLTKLRGCHTASLRNIAAKSPGENRQPSVIPITVAQNSLQNQRFLL